jgi:hypothetical protein
MCVETHIMPEMAARILIFCRLGSDQHPTKWSFAKGSGETKMAHISKIPGTGKFIFTSTTRSGNRIFTHMPEGVDAKYLGNIGITLPKGF